MSSDQTTRLIAWVDTAIVQRVARMQSKKNKGRFAATHRLSVTLQPPQLLSARKDGPLRLEEILGSLLKRLHQGLATCGR